MSKNQKAQIENEPWNKGKAIGQMAPFSSEQAQLIRSILEAEGNLRDLALFNTAIDTMLRASDLLALRVNDVCDYNGEVVEEFSVRQKKTKNAHVVTLSHHSREALKHWIIEDGKGPEDFLFTSVGNRKTGRAISRMQYSNLVKKWAMHARLDPKRRSTHSMRRTKSAVVYQQTHNLAACQHLLGHKNISSTAHYLGVEQRQALDLAKKIKV